MAKKMNPTVKAEWVADLRSGDILKTTRTLRDGDRMCVMGVLCNVHAKHHPDIAAQQTKKSEYMGNKHGIPIAVKNWAGLTCYSPMLKYKGRSFNIINLNDNENLSFKQIADLIEAQL